MNREPIKKIAILGGGIVGWMAAAILARGLKAEGVELTLIDIPDMPADDLAESSLPAIRQLHQMLGFDERQLMSITGASLSLEQNINGARQPLLFIRWESRPQ